MTGSQRDLRKPEIIEWLLRHPRAYWFAIDDRADQFTHHRDRLIAFDRTAGFTPDDGQQLFELVTDVLAV